MASMKLSLNVSLSQSVRWIRSSFSRTLAITTSRAVRSF